MAGGYGTRLWPTTKATNKHLLPVYDKPMIYYPLTTIMLAGIRDILIIAREEDIPAFKGLLAFGRQWGLRIDYAIQDRPKGIAEALLIGEKFIGLHRVALILGDNIFYGAELPNVLQRLVHGTGAAICCQQVADPSRYGVIEFNDHGDPADIQEKPKNPESNWAVTGLYFYDTDAISYAKYLEPSPRGELEITDINRAYLRDKTLVAERLGRGFAWFDTGTHQSLLQASNFIYTLQERQGMRIGDPEEVAATMGWL